ncbi:mucin-3A-like [Argopecten irradians]|uniref:mucin-3A-like n=1 Tax=Argopecten irradians TaxID=31199 RepID=UPI0037122921
MTSHLPSLFNIMFHYLLYPTCPVVSQGVSDCPSMYTLHPFYPNLCFHVTSNSYYEWHKAACPEGGSLAQPYNMVIHEFIITLLDTVDNYYIGLNDTSNQMRWVDGEVYSGRYEVWGNQTNEENLCVYYLYNGQWEWYLSNCSISRLLVCEYVISSHSPNVILIGNAFTFDGRVEIYHSNRWGTITHDNPPDSLGVVICGTLGLTFLDYNVSTAVEDGTGPVWLDGVDCVHLPATIEECALQEAATWGNMNAPHSIDVKVRCTDNAPTCDLTDLPTIAYAGQSCSGVTTLNCTVTCATLLDGTEYVHTNGQKSITYFCSAGHWTPPLPPLDCELNISNSSSVSMATTTTTTTTISTTMFTTNMLAIPDIITSWITESFIMTTTEILQPTQCVQMTTTDILQPTQCVQMTTKILQPTQCVQMTTTEILQPTQCVQVTTKEILQSTQYVQVTTTEILQPTQCSQVTTTVQTTIISTTSDSNSHGIVPTSVVYSSHGTPSLPTSVSVVYSSAGLSSSAIPVMKMPKYNKRKSAMYSTATKQDNRPSAVAIGSLGVIILVSLLGGAFYLDLLTIGKERKVFRGTGKAPTRRHVRPVPDGRESRGNASGTSLDITINELDGDPPPSDLDDIRKTETVEVHPIPDIVTPIGSVPFSLYDIPMVLPCIPDDDDTGYFDACPSRPFVGDVMDIPPQFTYREPGNITDQREDCVIETSNITSTGEITPNAPSPALLYDHYK